jgi:hypothetical protein
MAKKKKASTGTTAIADPLTKEDKKELRSAERTIANGWDTFVKVGKALATIRDSRLYRETHKSFEAYTRDKWQYGKAYASRLIGAAETVEDLNSIEGKTLPANESQVRPLLSLPREKRPEAWQKVIEQSEGGKLTARLVSQVASDFQEGEKPKPRKVKRATTADWLKVSEAMQNALEVAQNSENEEIEKAVNAVKSALDAVMPKG